MRMRVTAARRSADEQPRSDTKLEEEDGEEREKPEERENQGERNIGNLRLGFSL